MRMKRLLTALTAVALALASPLVASADQKPIVIGMAIAKSGFMTAYDEDPARAVEIAVADQNAKGGILGRPLKLIYADTKTDPAEAFKAGSELVQEGADFIIASCDFDMGGPSQR